jgi:biopolymer transport protein TolR
MEHDHSRSNVMAEINMTPMVDVMLVLLIIFMVVTPVLMAGFKAELPQGVNLKERPDDESRTTLGIDVGGNYYLNRQPIAKSDAARLLKAEFDRHPDDRVLFVKADRSLEYGAVREAMEIARTAGAAVVAAVTEQVETEPAPDRR